MKKLIIKIIILLLLALTIKLGYEQITTISSLKNVNKQETKIIYNGKFTVDGIPYISEHIMFPANINSKNLMLEMCINRPDDDGIYPVLILTHGRNGPFPSKDINTYKYFSNANWCFLKEQLIVVQVVRRGFGLSEGSNMDEYKMTPIDSGKEMVKDIEQALIYMKSKPYVIQDKFVIGGHSQGGWAALTTASANLDGVKCIINFSGATNYIKQVWWGDWPRKANVDFTHDCIELGQTSEVPSLWIYGDSEPYNTRDQIENMYFSYINSGGNAKLLLLPNTQHYTVSNNAPELWARSVHDFLVENNVIEFSVFQPSTTPHIVNMGGQK